MGRNKKNAVHGFFSYEKAQNSSRCLVSGCSAIIKGSHGTNLLYHLSSKHEEEFRIVQKRNEIIGKDNDQEIQSDNDMPSSSTSIPHRTRSKIELLRRECINLVTIHGRPFALLDDTAFKNILTFTSFSQRELQSINSHSIRDAVIMAAREKREMISSEFKNRLICIKVDGATCQDRVFLGINAQYVENGKIVIRNLGVTELHSRSTADFIKEKLLRIIRKYNLSVNQIYSVTTDNGSNMIKMTRLLNETLADESDTDDDDMTYDMTANLEITIDEIDSLNSNQYSITSIRCAAHTLQLAINDALREIEALNTIEDARRIVRRLRTPTMKNILKSSNKRKPILDCPTRWNSTLEMLERLVELRECCSNTPGDILYLPDTTWAAIQDLIKSLTPAKILTKQLQSEQLTLGDFFYFWTKCFMDTAKIMVPLAQLICHHMDIRKKMLMGNKTFVSALYLDPRFQVVLSPEEVTVAINHINATWLQLLNIEERSNGESLRVNIYNNNVDEEHLEQDDEMEALLALTESNKRRDSRVYYESQTNIAGMLENFSRHPRINYKENILNFWHLKKTSNPQLARLACTIFATPATQVSVERLFSSLKFVLSSLRYNLSEEIVEDILVLRNN